MRYPTLTLILGLLIISCSTKQEKEQETTDPKSKATENTPTIGERTNGLTTVYDSINGRPIFNLNDNVLVDCTEPFNGWYEILIYTDIDTAEYRTLDKLNKGRKLRGDGETIGEILTEMPAYGATNNREAWLRLSGFIPKESIKPETIIESAFQQYCLRVNSRKMKDYTQFINDFRLDSTQQFGAYKVFTCYENSIDDPSPMYRMGLVFEDDNLVAILHSRQIEISGTTDSKLDRGFDCLVYNDVADKDTIVEMFNRFVHAVD